MWSFHSLGFLSFVWVNVNLSCRIDGYSCVQSYTTATKGGMVLAFTVEIPYMTRYGIEYLDNKMGTEFIDIDKDVI